MKFRLGLTGSIGSGKSTTAAMFADLGCKIWDADAAVHRLYDKGGAAVQPISDIYPNAIANGAVSRAVLRDIIGQDPKALPRIEALVHPLVQTDRAEFAKRHPDKIGVFDIPLLFETGGDKDMDAVVVVHVGEATQRQRVLDRGTMSDADLDRILSRQMTVSDKLARADFAILTDTVEHARAQVQTVYDAIQERLLNA